MPPHHPRGTGKPKNIKQTILRILSYIKGYRLLMLFALLCIAFSSAASIAGTYFLKPLINDYILPFIGQENPDLSDFITMLCIMGLIYLLGVIASYTSSRIMLTISALAKYSLRQNSGKEPTMIMVQAMSQVFLGVAATLILSSHLLLPMAVQPDMLRCHQQASL